MSDDKSFPVRTLLFASVAVNLLVIGGVIGVLVSGARLHRPGGPEFGPGPRVFMQRLPPEHEAQIRGILENSWKASATERAAARDARTALFSAVMEQPFNEAKVRAALANMRSADETLASKNQDAVLGVLKDLEPHERAAALAGLTRGRFMGGGGDGRRVFIDRRGGPGDGPPMPGDDGPDDHPRPPGQPGPPPSP